MHTEQTKFCKNFKGNAYVNAEPLENAMPIEDRVTAKDLAQHFGITVDAVWSLVMKSYLPKPCGKPMYWHRSILSELHND